MHLNKASYSINRGLLLNNHPIYLFKKAFLASGIILCLFSCGLDEEGLFDFAPENADQLEENQVSSPVYLSSAGELISGELNLLRASDAVEALSKVNRMLEGVALEGTGFYFDFLKSRLEVIDLFKENKAGVTDVNNAVFRLVDIDSLFAEANQLPLSISFSENEEVNSLTAEKPLSIEFLFDDGSGESLVPVTLEADSIDIVTTEQGGLFISYVERLKIRDQVEYTYTLEIEYNESLETDYVVIQRYLIGSGTLAFKLENRSNFSELIYNLTQDAELLINSNIKMEKDDSGNYESGSMVLKVDGLEVVGEIFRAGTLLEKLKLTEKQRTNFTDQSEAINDAFDGHITLFAQESATEAYVADVTIDSRPQDNGTVTGYTFLYPESEVIFLPDFMTDVLNKVNQDFRLFNSVLR